MLSLGPGQNVGYVAGSVIAAFRRGDAHLVESGDLNVRRAKNRLAVDRCIRTQIQPERPGIEAVIGVVEELIERTDTKQDLVGQPRCDHRVPDQGIVLYVQWSDFEVVA